VKVYRQPGEIPKIASPVCTMGTFDGVHLGHRKTIAQLIENAKKAGGESVLLSFEPHPRLVLYPDDHRLELIQSLEQRVASLEDTGLAHLILYPFTKELSRTAASDFVREVLVKRIGIAGMTIGYNHQFGRNREGNLSLLKELGSAYHFKVDVVDALEINSEKVSSTKIREAVKSGEIPKANQYLGRNFGFSGTVVTGNQIGGKMGFPTVNIVPLAMHQLIPGNGVYAVRVTMGGNQLKGMCNIGYRPTVSDSGELRIEIHLLDFDREVYGEGIELEFIQRIRDEQKFPSREALQMQLKQDEITCRELLSVGVAGNLG